MRRSSSYYESLQRLNAGFARRGLAPVRLREAPEALENEDLLEMLNAGLVSAGGDRRLPGHLLGAGAARHPAPAGPRRQHRRGNRLDVPEGQPATQAGDQRVPGPVPRRLGHPEHAAPSVSQEHPVRPECHDGGRVGEIQPARGVVPQVRRPIRDGLPAHDGAGLPGIAARPVGAEPRRRRRGHAGHAGHRAGSSAWATSTRWSRTSTPA